MSFENRYGRTDKLLHELAFSAGPALTALADVEDLVLGSRYRDITVDRPVFVAALPRAGTTMLLSWLVESGEFASHTYRDMPFLLCPLLWSSFSGRFGADQRKQERAHGDGIEVSVDSPEAFEEMIWKPFWADHYRDDRIQPWQSCDDDEFLDFFTRHIRKIIAVRGRGNKTLLRYASKNNLNIARLRALPTALPGAILVVPFRDPVQHAASLLKQHVRFTQLHEEDPFAKRYMAGVGHHDFGLNLLPVDFDGWLADDWRERAGELQFWIEYWIATYRSISEQRSDAIHLLSYDDFVAQPEAGLSWLGSVTGVQDPTLLVAQADSVRAPRTHEVGVADISEQVRESAYELYETLRKRSPL